MYISSQPVWLQGMTAYGGRKEEQADGLELAAKKAPKKKKSGPAEEEEEEEVGTTPCITKETTITTMFC